MRSVIFLLVFITYFFEITSSLEYLTDISII